MTKTFEETISVLRQAGLVYGDESPVLPTKMPQWDDENPTGFSIFRTGLEDLDLSNLDMKRTFFSKSELVNCNLKGTNLLDSNLCWNDFIGVDFSNANLSGSDLRASIFENSNFNGSDLSGADMRMSDFNGCTFISANMKGAKLTRAAGGLLALSEKQKAQISWQQTDGDEPDGG